MINKAGEKTTGTPKEEGRGIVWSARPKLHQMLYLSPHIISITVISATLPEAKDTNRSALFNHQGWAGLLTSMKKIQNIFNKDRLTRFENLFSLRIWDVLKTLQPKEKFFFMGSFCSLWGFWVWFLGRLGGEGGCWFFSFICLVWWVGWGDWGFFVYPEHS